MEIIILIGTTEYLGYLIQRILGAKIGAIAAGMLGGLVSSTAVLLSISRKVARGEVHTNGGISICLFATMSSLLVFVAVVATTSPKLMAGAGFPVSISAILIGFFGYFASIQDRAEVVDGAAHTAPLDLRRVVILSTIICGLLTITAIVKRSLGRDAFLAVSFISGLFELQATSFADAMLHRTGEVTTEAANWAPLLATLGSFLSKIAIALAIGSVRFAAWIVGAIVIAAVAGASVAGSVW
jgi:uncharacterized membrane protein (DUF4010 family)